MPTMSLEGSNGQSAGGCDGQTNGAKCRPSLYSTPEAASIPTNAMIPIVKHTRVAVFMFLCPLPLLLPVLARAEEGFDEGGRIELGDILGLLAQADELHGDVELVLDGDDDAAAGGAVELG